MITRPLPVFIFNQVDSRHSTRHTEPKEPLPSYSICLNKSHEVSTILTFSSSVFLFEFAKTFYDYSSFFFMYLLSVNLLLTKCKLPVLCLLFWIFIFLDKSAPALLTPPLETYDTCEICDSVSTLSRALDILGLIREAKPLSPSIRFFVFFNLLWLLGGTKLVRGDNCLLLSVCLIGHFSKLFVSVYGP